MGRGFYLGLFFFGILERMNEMIENEMGHGAIVKKGERLLVEVEILQDIDVWENDALLLKSLFEDQPIGGEFKVTNLYFEDDAKIILTQHLKAARQHLDEIERKIMADEKSPEDSL